MALPQEEVEEEDPDELLECVPFPAKEQYRLLQGELPACQWEGGVGNPSWAPERFTPSSPLVLLHFLIREKTGPSICADVH